MEESICVSNLVTWSQAVLGHPVILLDQETDINFKEDKLLRTNSIKNKRGRQSFTSEIGQHDWSLDSEPAWGRVGKSAVIY